MLVYASYKLQRIKAVVIAVNSHYTLLEREDVLIGRASGDCEMLSNGARLESCRRRKADGGEDSIGWPITFSSPWYTTTVVFSDNGVSGGPWVPCPEDELVDPSHGEER